MKVLILGGNGFIGSHVADRMLNGGHRVRIYDRGPNAFRPSPVGVEEIFGDFLTGHRLNEAVDGVDIVFHLISTTIPATSNENPASDITENLIGTLHLLDIVRANNSPKIVFLSSGGTVYGNPNSIPVLETAPARPICSHGIVKHSVELYLNMYRELYGTEYVVLRVSNPYGERQGHFGVQGVIGTFIEKIRRNERIDIWGDGSVQRDYIYVGDVAEACELAAGSTCHGVYNIGSGVGTTLNEVIQLLATLTRRQVRPMYHPGRAYDVPRIVLDSSKAFEDFSWKANTEFEEGVAKTWQWASSRTE